MLNGGSLSGQMFKKKVLVARTHLLAEKINSSIRRVRAERLELADVSEPVDSERQTDRDRQTDRERDIERERVSVIERTSHKD
jgi:hypothetical protein